MIIIMHSNDYKKMEVLFNHSSSNIINGSLRTIVKESIIIIIMIDYIIISIIMMLLMMMIIRRSAGKWEHFIIFQHPQWPGRGPVRGLGGAF